MIYLSRASDTVSQGVIQSGTLCIVLDEVGQGQVTSHAPLLCCQWQTVQLAKLLSTRHVSPGSQKSQAAWGGGLRRRHVRQVLEPLQIWLQITCMLGKVREHPSGAVCPAGGRARCASHLCVRCSPQASTRHSSQAVQPNETPFVVTSA